MSNAPQLSAYVSAFNVVQHGLPYADALRAMLAFFDEVSVAVNASTDDTLATILALDPRLGVTETAFSYTDVTFDGAIKNAALQACTQDDPNRVYVQMDLDEMVPPSQYDLWRKVATQLLATDRAQCIMIPSVDVWGSMQAIRADKPIGLKFRMHRGGLRRGVWREAWLPGQRRFQTSMSDSCELIDRYGNLVPVMGVAPQHYLSPATCYMLSQGGYPFTVHFGYLDYNQRLRVNKAIWADHWTLRNGGEDARVATRLDQLLDVPLVPHNLKLT